MSRERRAPTQKERHTQNMRSSTTSITRKHEENVQNDAWGWRSEDDNDEKGRPQQQPPPLSRGLDPRRFHQGHRPHHRPNKPGTAVVEQMKTALKQERIAVGKRAVLQEQELKRSAYRSVTALQTFPTQQQALDFWGQLQQEYLRGGIRDTDDDDDNNNDDDDKNSNKSKEEKKDTASASSCSSSASSCSTAVQSSSTEGLSQAMAAMETKRQLINRKHSPAKSTRKQHYVQAFLNERQWKGPLPLPSTTTTTTTTTTTESHLMMEHNALWSMEPRIWSIEKSSTGRRKYVVGHTGRLMDRYWRRVAPEQRHYYELIAAQQPCRLYLDLEYAKLTNPHITAAQEEQLLTELLHELSAELQRVYPEHISRPLTRRDVVDLEATTPQKFSRHWIVHLPKEFLFRDTAVMGRFVQQWIGRLADRHATRQLSPLLQKYLLVHPAPSKATNPEAAARADGRPCCIVDLGVYTRNRLFRLMGSTKFGKSTAATLRIASANEFPLTVADNNNDDNHDVGGKPNSTTTTRFGNHLFYRPEMVVSVPTTIAADTSTSTATQENEQQSGNADQKESTSTDVATKAAATEPVADDAPFEEQVDMAVKGFQASVDWTFHAAALARTLVVPLNVSKMAYPILPDVDHDDDDDNTHTQSTQLLSSGSDNMSQRVGIRPFAPTHVGPSPFPALDDFVQTVLATRKGLPGSIRAWSMERHNNVEEEDEKYDTPISVTYQMSGNRWCECIQRAHKSNNIYWVVDLVLWHCVQRCHDPDCRALSFRGVPVPLPEDVRNACQQELIDQALAKLDEATLTKPKPETLSISQSSSENQVTTPSFLDAFQGDAEFEAALLALNLGPSTADATNDDDAKKEEGTTESQNDKKDAVSSVKEEDESDSDSDEPSESEISERALLEAMAAQPELFP